MRDREKATEGPRSRTRRDLKRGVLVAAPFFVLAVWVLFFAPRGFFSGDSGIKYAQAYTLWQSGYSTRALPYDDSFDPEHEFTPYRAFSRDVGGDQQGVYSVVFAAISAPFVGVFGTRGALLLPLLGGLLCFAALRLLLRRYECTERTKSIAVAILLLLTPLSFYSGQFVEHSIVAGLSLLALALLAPTPLSPRAPIAAGLCAGLAATLRPEMYCGAASIGAAILLLPDPPLRKRFAWAAWYAAVAGIVMIAYWGLNWRLSGTWDPLVALNSVGNAGWRSAEILIVGRVPGGYALLWLLPFAAAIAVAAVPASSPRLSRALRVVVLLAIAGVVIAAQATARGRTVAGLFAATPIAAYGLLGDHARGKLRPLWVFSVTLILQVMLLDKSGKAGGLQFGARFLLPVVPVLLAIAVVSVERDWRADRKRAARFAVLPAAIFLVLTSCAVVPGFYRAVKIARSGQTVVERVNALQPEIVVVRRTWEAQVLLPVLARGKRIYVERLDPVGLLTRLADAGHERFIFVSRRDTEVFLPGRRVARSTFEQKGWLDVHLMEVQPRD